VFSYSSATHTAQWTFAAPLATDKDLLEVPSSAVMSKFGMSLDGEWTTQSSGYPSGDGVWGGDFLFRFNVLPGAVTQNTVVTGIDGGAVRAKLFADTTSAIYSPLADVNGDGAVTSLDGAIVRANLLQALPSSDPQPQTPGGGGQNPASPLGAPASESGDASGPVGSASSQRQSAGGSTPARGEWPFSLAPLISTPDRPSGRSSPSATATEASASPANGIGRNLGTILSGQRTNGHSRRTVSSQSEIRKRLETLDSILEEFDRLDVSAMDCPR
jgi:hypothetical protein